MSDFDTEAELSLSVPSSELRNVRQQIEEGIGTVEVGVSDGASMSAQSARSDGGRGRRARRSMRLAETQTELLEDAVIYLEDIEDHVAEGGGLGGGGGLITEILGAGAETAGDVAVETGSTVADAISDTLTGAAASALGNTISSAITSSEVAVEDTTVTVEPNPLPVEGGGGGSNQTLSPTINTDTQLNPTFEPDIDFSPELDLPDLNFDGGVGTVGVDESQLPLPIDRTPLPVEEVDPIDLDITVDVSGKQNSGQPSSEPSFGQRFRDTTRQIPVFGDAIADADRNITETIYDVAPGRSSEDLSSKKSQRANQAQAPTATTTTAEVSYSPTYNLEVDPRRFDQLATQIVDEVEKRVDRDLDQLRDDVEDLERDLEDLERGIASGGGVSGR